MLVRVKEPEIEVYASRCFKCHAPIYLKSFELKYGGNNTLFAYDCYSNSHRHYCIQKLHEVINPRWNNKK